MPKTASIRTIEQAIESLPQSDQFALLEKLLKHLKHSLVGAPILPAAEQPADSPKSLRGALKSYADHSRRDAEKSAFGKAMKAKHAHS